MFSWFKYLIFAVFLVAVIIASGYFNNQQNASIAAIQDVNTTLQSSVTGNMRAMEKGKLSKKEIAAGLIREVIESQKSNSKDLKVEYVFLDKNGAKTLNDEEIDSVQIHIATLNDKGEEETSAVQRISLKQE